jgi:hypothetical protein
MYDNAYQASKSQLVIFFSPENKIKKQFTEIKIHLAEIKIQKIEIKK